MDTPSLAAGIGNIYSHSELDNNSRDYSWLLHALYKHSINVTPPFREWIHLKCKGRFAMRIKWGADGLLDVLKRALDKISNTWLLDPQCVYTRDCKWFVQNRFVRGLQRYIAVHTCNSANTVSWNKTIGKKENVCNHLSSFTFSWRE